VERWWGPGWDGNLILSTNARPIPTISLDRRVPEPFETKWLSWIGPWSFHSFIGRLEKERTIPNPYLWGMRGEFRPTLVDGLEIGFFRMMQLGGKGRPEGFSTWVDSFLGQDNYGGQSKHQDKSKEPGNQLAGIDVRWKALDLPIAFYGQVVGEDEDNFLPNALMFQYGVEAWKRLSQSTIRVFAEYVDLTTIWWSDPDYSHNPAYNVSYGHTIYQDGYRFKGRPIGHWSDQDSRIITAGCILQRVDGVGWGTTLKIGELNSDASGGSSISNKVSSDYFSMDVFNSRYYPSYDLAVYSSIGWESIAQQSSTKNRSVTGSLMLTKKF